MKKSTILSVLISLVVIFSLLAACAPAAEEPAAEEPAAEEPAAEEPAAEEPAAEEAESKAGVVCPEFDKQTCDFLEGKDFTGQTLVVGVWGGTIEAIVRDTIIPVLEDKGATIELSLGGTGDRMAKVYAEKDNPTMHIAYLNIFQSLQSVRDGVTEKSGSKIPAYDDLYPLAQTSCYGCSFIGLGIAYNKDAFPDGPPNWIDLWEPSHKGYIALPRFPGTEGEGFLAMAARVHGSDETDPDFAFEKLQELKPFVMTYQNLEDIFPLIESGEVHAAPMISAYAFDYIEQGMDFGFSWPEDGIVQMMDSLCIVANNPNPELADAYTQVALSSPVQTAYAERLYFGPTNSTVVLSDEVAEKTVYGEKAEELLALNWDAITENTVPNTEKWNKLLLED